MVDEMIKILGLIPYRGCTIERIEGGYKVFGKVYPTLYLAKKRIDLAFIKFNTIKTFS